MNGRIYDPLLGRMFSADVVVQFSQSLQSYNRYSYKKLDGAGQLAIVRAHFYDELARLGIYPLSHKIELNERDRRFHEEGQIKDIVKACMADWDHKPLKNDIGGRE